MRANEEVFNDPSLNWYFNVYPSLYDSREYSYTRQEKFGCFTVSKIILEGYTPINDIDINKSFISKIVELRESEPWVKQLISVDYIDKLLETERPKREPKVINANEPVKSRWERFYGILDGLGFGEAV